MPPVTPGPTLLLGNLWGLPPRSDVFLYGVCVPSVNRGALIVMDTQSKSGVSEEAIGAAFWYRQEIASFVIQTVVSECWYVTRVLELPGCTRWHLRRRAQGIQLTCVTQPRPDHWKTAGVNRHLLVFWSQISSYPRFSLSGENSFLDPSS